MSPAQRRLLTILLVQPREWQTEALIEWMWGDEPPASARNALQVHVSALRRWLPIETTGSGYRLQLEGVELDRDVFEGRVGAAVEHQEAARWDSARETAREARALWRGSPYADLDGDTHGAVTRLTELLLQAADVEVEALLATGRNAAAIVLLAELIEEHPYRDRLRHRLMLALYRDGRQGEALREFQDYRHLLGETMGIEPGEELKGLEEQILLHDPGLGLAAEAKVPNNLPPSPTSFIGREDDLRRITKELAEVGIASVVGEPGVGKTRLAIEVGRAALEDHPAGVWFVDLTGATDIRSLTAMVSAAVSAPEGADTLDLLAAAIRGRPLLLILDNCEHVVEPVRSLLLAVAAEPAVCRVLSTSRRPVGLESDSVYRLRPLAITRDESVALLVDRARSVDRTFSVSDGDALLDLCSRLDGNPLAIELVARRVPVLGVVDIARLLDQVKEDTALDAAVEWSLNLLPPGDADVLARLAIFRSPFTLDRAVDVVGQGERAMAITGSISRLVDGSLLRAVWAGLTARYQMLPPIRDLMSAAIRQEERPVLSGAHRASFLDSAADLVAGWQGDHQTEVLADAGMEMADYRAALEGLVDCGDWAGVIGVCEALTPYWYANFLGWEGLVWLDEVPVGDLDVGSQAAFHRVAGYLTWALHDYARSDAHYLDLEAIGLELGDRVLEADGLCGQGLIHQKRRFKDGGAMLDRAASIYEELLPGTARQLGECLLFRGIDDAYWGQGHDGEARLARAASLLEDAGHTRQVSKAERWLAHCAWRRGDEPEAHRHARRAEELAVAVGDRIALAGAMVEQANIAITWGEPQVAARLIIEALAQVPVTDEIDMAQVLIPAARLAVRLDDHIVAGSALDWVESAFERHGWRALGEIPTAKSLRSQVPRHTPGTAEEARGVVAAFLDSVAAT